MQLAKSGFPASGRNTWIITLSLYIVSIGISLYPLLNRDILSVGDIANHLVRGWVILHYHDHPELATYFRLNRHVVPNLAIDMFVVAFGGFLTLGAIAKLFVGTTFAVLLGGCVLLHKATFGRWSVWPMLAATLLYNRILVYGLANYLLASGVYLIAFAVWIRFRHRPAWGGLVAFTVLAMLSCLAHLFAFGLLGLSVAAWEAARVIRRRTAIIEATAGCLLAGLAFLPTVLTVLILRPPSSGLAGISYHTFIDRLAAFAAPAVFDLATNAAGAAIIALTMLVLIERRMLRISPELGIVWLILALAQLAMPDRIITAQGADHRIPIVLYFLAVSATDIAAVSRGAIAAFAVLVLALTTGRTWQVERNWRRDDGIYAEVRSALSAVPDGAMVATAYPPSMGAHVVPQGIAIYYLPLWEIVPRGGFTQTMFAYPSQHPLVMQPEFAALAQQTPAPGMWTALTSGGSGACDTLRALQRYDFVILLDQSEPPDVSRSFLLPVSQDHYERLYRVLHTPAACSP